jgi:hypothetical protein
LIILYMVLDNRGSELEGSNAFSGQKPHQLLRDPPSEQRAATRANSVPPGKFATPSTALPSPSTSQSPSPQTDAPLRRSGGTGSFGAGASSRPTAAPRNNQASRKQHKPRRPRIYDEDAVAEAVSFSKLGFDIFMDLAC